MLMLSILSCRILSPDDDTPRDETWRNVIVKFVFNENGTKITYFRFTPRTGNASYKGVSINDKSFEVPFNDASSGYGHVGTVTGKFNLSKKA